MKPIWKFTSFTRARQNWANLLLNGYHFVSGHFDMGRMGPGHPMLALTCGRLSDRAFHLQLDQAFELDAVFHRELADEIVDETVDAQAHRLRLSQATLLHVEDLL